MTEENRDFLLVAAIDIGTTYSGDAYSMKDTYKTNPLTIHANQAWNADGRTVLPLKTPTCLLLNSKKEFDSFGYEAENKYADLVMVGEQDNYYYFHGFKINMHTNKNEDSNMMLEDITGKIVPAIDVFALSIKALVNHLMYTLTQGTGMKLDDIQWVLTVPAIWTDNLMQLMRTSSEKAGLKRDHLLILKESEAAALFCQHLPIEKLRGGEYGCKMSKIGKRYMIVDLGGATVDVTVHDQLFGGRIKEFCRRTNGGCGGTSVDTCFIHMFENIFGKPLLNTMKREHPLVYLELLREIETVKMTIIPTKTGKINIKVPFPTLDALCKTHLQKDVISTVLESTYSRSISIRGDKMRIEEKLFKSFFIQL
ncbi:unnamed protein product [Mytilus edulis]|uniref:Uncharacterized protein n=1 Tax=Mytilus edulis TaxID=6550 RepID=A0A8S3RMK8_MYTED|nr:unnamed protein product [Mytilus edulis]